MCVRAGISGELMRDDDNLLRNMFFTILRHHQPKLATKLDVVYALSSAWSQSESDSDFELLEQRLKDLNPDELIMVRRQPRRRPVGRQAGEAGGGRGVLVSTSRSLVQQHHSTALPSPCSGLSVCSHACALRTLSSS